MITGMRMRGPRAREMFSPDFLVAVSEGRFPHWWRVGDMMHHTDHTGTHLVWRLGEPDPRTRFTLGVWPD